MEIMKNSALLLFVFLVISCSEPSESLQTEKFNTINCKSDACREESCSSLLNVVWLDNPEEQIPIYQREIEYASEMINNSNTAPDLVALFTVIKQETEIMLNLFTKNDFKLTSKGSIDEYNSSVKRYGKAMSELPADYQEILYNI